MNLKLNGNQSLYYILELQTWRGIEKLDIVKSLWVKTGFNGMDEPSYSTNLQRPIKSEVIRCAINEFKSPKVQ